jgi:shikimate kinase
VHRPFFLIGYRGTGKSTVARLLAQRICWAWLDSDALLETRAGRSIRQIFAEEGEAAFRALEADLLPELCLCQGHVIATGGGVVLREENRLRLKQNGIVVWLRADATTLWQRLQTDATTATRRPNLTVGGLAEIEELLRVREPLYADCAHCVVDTVGRSAEDVAEAILDNLPAVLK